MTPQCPNQRQDPSATAPFLRDQSSTVTTSPKGWPEPSLLFLTTSPNLLPPTGGIPSCPQHPKSPNNPLPVKQQLPLTRTRSHPSVTSSLRAAEPSSYQHEVDVEAEDLVTHVHAVGVGEVIAQVCECAGRALEVGAGNLHALRGQEDVCRAYTCCRTPETCREDWKNSCLLSHGALGGWWGFDAPFLLQDPKKQPAEAWGESPGL